SVKEEEPHSTTTVGVWARLELHLKRSWMLLGSFLFGNQLRINLLRDIQCLADAAIRHGILAVLRVRNEIVDRRLGQILSAAPEFGIQGQDDSAHAEKLCHHGSNYRVHIERAEKFRSPPFAYRQTFRSRPK